MGGCFYLFSSVVVCVLVIVFFMLPETKGMSLEDIEDFFSGSQDTKTEQNNSSIP